MKTSLDRIDVVWQLLNGSSLKSNINGVVCKTRRPAGSTNEDVVINSLFVDNEQLQSGIINVNLYIPNKAQKFGEIQDNSQPNFARLKELVTIAVELLDDVYVDGFFINVQQQFGPLEDENNQHFINIRVQIRTENF
jgi:hypothetical protein